MATPRRLGVRIGNKIRTFRLEMVGWFWISVVDHSGSGSQRFAPDCAPLPLRFAGRRFLVAAQARFCELGLEHGH